MDALRHALQDMGRLTPQPSPYEAIQQAASETGADFDYLWRTAQRESGLNPSARAQTSSAAGLFQFTSDTWLRMIERYGEKYGVDDVVPETEAEKKALLALRDDPVASARMAGELARENASILSRSIGREATPQELYAAHFLGPSGAAALIKAVREEPGQVAEELFPGAARANANIFNASDGAPRTVAAVYARLTGDVLSQVDAHTSSQDTPSTERIFHASASPSSGLDTLFDAAESLQNARVSQALMSALIHLQTHAASED